MRSILVAVLAMAAAATASSNLDLQEITRKLQLGASIRAGRSVSDMVSDVALKLNEVLTPVARGFASPASRAAGTPPGTPPDIAGSFYGFIPEFVGGVKLPGVNPTFGATVPKPVPVSRLSLNNSRCFSSVTVSAYATGTDPSSGAPSFNLTFATAGAKASPCDELYLIATAATFQLVSLDALGVHSVPIANVDTPAGAAEWTAREGVRILRFYGGFADTVTQILDTVSLFVPALTSGPELDAASMKLNRDFIKQYLNLTTVDRPKIFTGIDAKDINTGDMLAIHRADGLGTLEQFGTGEATSHIAMAVRIGPLNQLFVVESTDKDAYWPNPNIQKTAWDDWIAMSLACNYTVTLLQLKDELRAPGVWDTQAANNWIEYTLGYPYGYHNFLWTFQDVPGGNFPKPLDWHAAEVLFRIIEDVDADIATKFVTYAMNFRLSNGASWKGADSITEVANAAAKQGMTFGELYSIPEQDSWMYPDGPSMVCDSYACSIYKAAGLFRHYGIADDEINCVEFDNADAYTLAFFKQQSEIPQVCRDTDPGSPYCYVMGSYTIDLRGFNSVTPYKHMGEACSAQYPDFTRPPQC
ncbi:hypothetical protein FNF27_04642 [Cafeteria roenbergensis]|uniref:Phospholipase B-like n=1 Tax=Cafeteria roenbergensis TaxID=33653 RepID=A0A5A8E839_CAFRO|nr:hypothetical protein FNF27_04642 [Cafeteria roenbergensis]